MKGFIECRKHCEQIITLVEMMQEGGFIFSSSFLSLLSSFNPLSKIILNSHPPPSLSLGSNFPCFVGGAASVDLLRQRFCTSMPEEDFVQHVEVMKKREEREREKDLFILFCFILFCFFIFSFTLGVDHQVL